MELAEAAYPRLRVFKSRPPWMSQSAEAEYRADCECTGFRWKISQPSGWLKRHLEELP